jgi:hypothetical protein
MVPPNSHGVALSDQHGDRQKTISHVVEHVSLGCQVDEAVTAVSPCAHAAPTGHLSFWHDSLEPGDELRPRPALPGDVDVDVAVVGAGFTGLWTAYYLARADPHLRVTVIEREVAGFGASGRNGGWCVGDQAAPLHALERAWPGAAAAMVEEMHRSVDEVGAVAAAEGIDCGFAKGGAIYLATNPFQLRRLRQLQTVHEQFGLGDTYQLLSPRETTDVVNATGVFGGLFNLHAAALHPARLARGLAVAVERLGATVHEGTAATGRGSRTDFPTGRRTPTWRQPRFCTRRDSGWPET